MSNQYRVISLKTSCYKRIISAFYTLLYIFLNLSFNRLRFFFINYFSYIRFMMTKVEVQNLIKKVYPKLKDYYGLSKFCVDYPTVKLHHNIYARLTGIDEMVGECNPAAEFERETNTIWIYWLEAVDEQWVIGTLLHEYTHYLQDGNEMKKLYNNGYTYENHPFELAASQEEEKWNLFL